PCPAKSRFRPGVVCQPDPRDPTELPFPVDRGSNPPPGLPILSTTYGCREAAHFVFGEFPGNWPLRLPAYPLSARRLAPWPNTAWAIRIGGALDQDHRCGSGLPSHSAGGRARRSCPAVG